MSKAETVIHTSMTGTNDIPESQQGKEGGSNLNQFSGSMKKVGTYIPGYACAMIFFCFVLDFRLPLRFLAPLVVMISILFKVYILL